MIGRNARLPLRWIDEMVYALYGLTEKEIGVVGDVIVFKWIF